MELVTAEWVSEGIQIGAGVLGASLALHAVALLVMGLLRRLRPGRKVPMPDLPPPPVKTGTDAHLRYSSRSAYSRESPGIGAW